MAGFVDGFKKAWNGVKSAGSGVYDAGKYIVSGQYAEDFVNSDIFPYRRFEELAAIAPAKMTEAEKAEYEKLQPQITQSAKGFAGTMGVVTQRSVEATADAMSEIADGAGRGLDNVIKEKTTFGKILGWITENWQLALAGIIGVAGMFSGGFIGSIATAGAALLAGNGLAEKITGKSLLDMGSDLIGNFTKDKPEPQVSVKERVVGTVANVEIPSMEKLAAVSGIDYKTNHADREKPKMQTGFVEGLVKGAQQISHSGVERFA